MIADFLNKFRPGGPWLLVAIHPDKKGSPDGVTFTDAAKAEAWALEKNKTHNIYFSINPTRKPLNKKAEKTDIARLEWLHVDIDPAAGEDFEQERERIKAMLTTKRPEGIPEPSIIIDSGNGFWGMFRLSEPLDIPPPTSETDKPWERAEAYNRHLETVFRADHCFNIDRIARLPGLTNWPDANKRKKGRVPRDAELYSRSDAVYPLTAFKAAPPITGGTPTASRKASPRAAMGDGTAPDENWIPGTASPFGTEELKTWAVERGKWHGDEEKPTPPGKIGQRLLAVMAQGADPLDATRYPSRSEAQFYVSCELVRAGVPDELHYRILTTPGSGVADSVLDQKSDVHGYALRQIRKAHEEAEREWWRSPDAAMNYLNNKHAVIADIGGKCRIITEVRDPALKRTKISKQSFEDFRNRYRHIKVLVESPDDGKPVFKAAGAFWIDDPKRRQYETITFAPGKEIEDAYNLWRGFAVESRPGDRHESFLAHVRDNVCAGNPEHFAYLLGWMARAVQEPDSPGEVAVVIRGGRGTGKSFFAKMFGRLFGRHYLQVSDSKHLTGSFNAHLRDTVLLFGDEAFYAGDKKHESILKTLVTEEHLVIEGKGVDAEAGSNYVHLILASNEDWVVPAGLDERRFFALEVGEAHKQDHAYFKAITGDLYNGGLEHLLHFLLTYDLSAFEVRQVPKTQALRGQQIESLKGFEKYLYEQLWEAALPKCGKPDGPRWFVFSTPLVEVAVDWLNQRRESPKVSTSKVQRVLEKRLGVEKGRLDNLNGYYWDVAQMREAWDQEMFPVDWPPLPEKPPF